MLSFVILLNYIYKVYNSSKIYILLTFLDASKIFYLFVKKFKNLKYKFYYLFIFLQSVTFIGKSFTFWQISIVLKFVHKFQSPSIKFPSIWFPSMQKLIFFFFQILLFFVLYIIPVLPVLSKLLLFLYQHTKFKNFKALFFWLYLVCCNNNKLIMNHLNSPLKCLF